MYRVCIALVDANHARLFTWDRKNDAIGAGEQLIERGELVNPRPAHLVESVTSMHAAAGSNAVAYQADSQRWHISRTGEAEFARMAMAALRELIDDDVPRRVIICASPRMLVKLRTCAPGLLPDGMACDELPRDLATASPMELRGALAFHRLLPSCSCDPAAG